MTCSFVYFDMGKVLLEFDHAQMCRQMALAAGCPEDAVWRAVFDGGDDSLHRRIERGEWTPDETYRHFCGATGTNPDQAALEHAASDMFAPMPESIRLVESLQVNGYRLGVLSNTNFNDWRFVSGERYPFLNRCFETHVLSFEVGAMKPDPAIYSEAVRLAGVPAGDVFLTDDRPENVEGARQAGIDAVQFESAEQVARELAQRGVVAAL